MISATPMDARDAQAALLPPHHGDQHADHPAQGNIAAGGAGHAGGTGHAGGAGHAAGTRNAGGAGHAAGTRNAGGTDGTENTGGTGNAGGAGGVHGCTTLCIGNFDGVHRGHQFLLGGEAKVDASLIESPPPTATSLPARRVQAMTFAPHPRMFFHPPDDRNGFCLTSLDQRVALLQGVTGVAPIVVPFDAALAALSPEEFVQQHLVPLLHANATSPLGVDTVRIGADFRFGRDRAGDATTLKALGTRYGFRVEVVDLLQDSGHTADAAHVGDVLSSSAVRQAVAAGNMDAAAAVLGRPYMWRGQVTKGDQLGRTLGFPTANIPLRGYKLPPFGVYGVRGRLVLPSASSGASTAEGDPFAADGDPFAPPNEKPTAYRATDFPLRGVMNVGVRPTLAGVPTLRCETHFIDSSALQRAIDQAYNADDNDDSDGSDGGTDKQRAGKTRVTDNPSRDLDALYGMTIEIALLAFVRPEKRFESLDALSAQIRKDITYWRGTVH
ncbi:MAG: hypothetical protein K0U36_04455 [Alphaproteobacteria bacterium]|nr:hypothetical protein [Alphaproteobacteria bacterium]